MRSLRIDLRSIPGYGRRVEDIALRRTELQSYQNTALAEHSKSGTQPKRNTALRPAPKDDAKHHRCCDKECYKFNTTHKQRLTNLLSSLAALERNHGTNSRAFARGKGPHHLKSQLSKGDAPYYAKVATP